MKHFFIFFAVFFLVSFGTCKASPSPEGANWPQWGGPSRDFTSDETGYNPRAFADGADIVWTTNVNSGRSSVAVNDDRVYALGKHEKEGAVFCLNLRNGKIRWARAIQSQREELSTPVVDDDCVYVWSPAGEVHCLDAHNGEILWTVPVADTYDVKKPTYGFASSPMLYEDILVIHANSALVALDKTSGEEIWTHVDDSESLSIYGVYSTPFTVSREATTYLIRQGHASLQAYEIETGELVADTEVQKPGGMVNNIDDGIAGGSNILMSGIALESEMFSFNGTDFTSRWKCEDFKVDITPFVPVDGHLYGFQGTTGSASSLNCVNASSGVVIWREEIRRSDTEWTPSPFYGGLTSVDGICFILSKDGTLITADLSPHGYRELSRGELPMNSYWTPPVVTAGRLLAKNVAGEIYCVDVSE